MGAAKKLELTPDELFLQDALRTGRAIRTEISMKALGKPDVELQARVTHLDMTHVHRLGASLENQGFLAPVVVFKDAKGKLWLADGHHRHECYRKANKPAIPAYQITGERLDALEFATMCNRENCLGRTKEDEKKAVFMLFDQEKWFNISSLAIANHVGVASATASRWRAEYCQVRNIMPPDKLTGSDGRQTRKSARTPQVMSRVAGGFGKTINGKFHWLGIDESDAQKKLHEINRSHESKRLVLRQGILDTWMARHGISAKGINEHRMGLGTALLVKSAVLIPAELCTVGCIVELAGRALLNRHKHLPDGRAIVVCYDPPQCEALDVAKDMGVEFLTPEELVESLKNEPS